MPLYLCTKTNFAPVRDAAGNIEHYIPDAEKPHIKRHVTRYYQEGAEYNFPDSEMIPRNERAVRLMEDGKPVLHRDPNRPHDPKANMVPAFEQDINLVTGEVTTRYEDVGITFFRMINPVTGEVMSADETNEHAEAIRQRALTTLNADHDEIQRLRDRVAELEAREPGPATDVKVADEVQRQKDAEGQTTEALLAQRSCKVPGCKESMKDQHRLAQYCKTHQKRRPAKPAPKPAEPQRSAGPAIDLTAAPENPAPELHPQLVTDGAGEEPPL